MATRWLRDRATSSSSEFLARYITVVRPRIIGRRDSVRRRAIPPSGASPGSRELAVPVHRAVEQQGGAIAQRGGARESGPGWPIGISSRTQPGDALRGRGPRTRLHHVGRSATVGRARGDGGGRTIPAMNTAWRNVRSDSIAESALHPARARVQTATQPRAPQLRKPGRDRRRSRDQGRIYPGRAPPQPPSPPVSFHSPRGVAETVPRPAMDMRQYAGFGTSRGVNQPPYKYLLAQGARASRSRSTCRPRWAATPISRWRVASRPGRA